jgi:glycosyltransferase involved in cell wall biosynthesis
MPAVNRTWHILTGEYPPACGGVGDYTAALAQALSARGEEVHVWAPGLQPGRSAPWLHPLEDRFGSRARTQLERAVRDAPGTLLLQYVPNALGARGANLAFCRWLLDMGCRGADVRVMFHEPYFYFGWRRPWRNVLAVAQRTMAARLLRASSEVYFSSANWRRYLSPYGPIRGGTTLPIPSTLPTIDPLQRRPAAVRATPIVGHFGTYGADVATALEAVLPRVLEACPAADVRLIGRGGERFVERFGRGRGRQRLHATGELPASDAASALRECDLVIQPYPDGVTTRRTSVMAAIGNGVPVVTTSGFLTEPVWQATGAVRLVPFGDTAAFAAACADLLADAAARDRLAAAALRAYDAAFSVDRTAALLAGPAPALAAAR